MQSRDDETGAAAAAPTISTFALMRAARRWLVAGPDKIPYYVSGGRRSGPLDSLADMAALATYEEARAAVQHRPGYVLGFALGPDGRSGNWQGIDFDNVQANGLADLANTHCGYVEFSPSGTGAHFIGYGRPFPALGSNGTGIEAYSSGRYFTVTEQPISDGVLCDLAEFVERCLVGRHASHRDALQASPDSAAVSVDPKTVAELRSALSSMRSDEYHLWVRMGLALKELGDVGRGLWLDWSRTSEKYDAQEAARKWDGFRPSNIGYATVFAEAQKRGWVNPLSSAAKLRPVGESQFQAKRPHNILGGSFAPPLGMDLFPPAIADFARSYSSAHGFDAGGLAMAAVAAAAAMLDDRIVLEIKPGWQVSARLWVVLIGRSATGKSPSIKAATRAIKAKHMQLVGQYKAMLSEIELEEGEQPPPEPALFTSDATIEALSSKLTGNPRGLLMLTEEFASWIGAIDSTARGDAAKNRGAWLQLYDGGIQQIDRIGRGSIQVENWSASVLTATTPSALADHMRHLPEDGLLQRFIPVILGPRDHDADGDAGAAMAEWDRILMGLFTLQQILVLPSPDARRRFKDIERELGIMAEATDDVSTAFASHLGKHSEMIARVALVFHELESPSSNTLTTDTVERAAKLMAALRQHASALYRDILGRSETMELARALAKSLVAADPSTAEIGRDWMTNHCRAFQKTENDRVRRQAVQLLEDFDWIKDISVRSYGGWPTKWEVNRQIFTLFAKEGKAHRERRAAVKAAFAPDEPEES